MLAMLAINASTGPETLSLQVGLENGLFTRHGLEIQCEVATGSIPKMVWLIDGKYHMAMTAMDNLIAYVEGQGAADTENPADLIAFLGSNSETRPLMAVPDIGGFEDLKGRRIAVDALGTGFSFMRRQTLEDHGLGLDDYELAPVGNVPARWQAMQAGDCVAGLLSEAFAAMAREAGCSELTTEPEPWDDYQGGVYMADRSWVGSHGTEVKGFIAAYLDAVDWILAPDNFDQLPGLLLHHLPHMSPEAAGQAARALHSPGALLKPGMPLNLSGIARVMDLRRKYGTPPASLGETEKYLDLTCYGEIMATRT